MSIARVRFCIFGVYIPLCLYFNNLLDKYYQAMEVLYIPLCLYFNQVLYDLRTRIRTLHSIMSLF